MKLDRTSEQQLNSSREMSSERQQSQSQIQTATRDKSVDTKATKEKQKQEKIQKEKEKKERERLEKERKEQEKKEKERLEKEKKEREKLMKKGGGGGVSPGTGPDSSQIPASATASNLSGGGKFTSSNPIGQSASVTALASRGGVQSSKSENALNKSLQSETGQQQKSPQAIIPKGRYRCKVVYLDEGIKHFDLEVDHCLFLMLCRL